MQNEIINNERCEGGRGGRRRRKGEEKGRGGRERREGGEEGGRERREGGEGGKTQKLEVDNQRKWVRITL